REMEGVNRKSPCHGADRLHSSKDGQQAEMEGKTGTSARSRVAYETRVEDSRTTVFRSTVSRSTVPSACAASSSSRPSIDSPTCSDDDDVICLDDNPVHAVPRVFTTAASLVMGGTVRSENMISSRSPDYSNAGPIVKRAKIYERGEEEGQRMTDIEKKFKESSSSGKAAENEEISSSVISARATSATAAATSNPMEDALRLQGQLSLSETIGSKRRKLREIKHDRPPASMEEAEERVSAHAEFHASLVRLQRVVDMMTKKSEMTGVVKALVERWHRLLADSIGYSEQLERERVHQEELRLQGWTFDEWRDRYVDWVENGEDGVNDMFRRLDEEGRGSVARDAFIGEIMESDFSTFRLEMAKVADMFNKGDGMIDLDEFIKELKKPDPESNTSTRMDVEVDDEVEAADEMRVNEQQTIVEEPGSPNSAPASSPLLDDTSNEVREATLAFTEEMVESEELHGSDCNANTSVHPSPCFIPKEKSTVITEEAEGSFKEVCEKIARNTATAHHRLDSERGEPRELRGSPSIVTAAVRNRSIPREKTTVLQRASSRIPLPINKPIFDMRLPPRTIDLREYAKVAKSEENARAELIRRVMKVVQREEGANFDQLYPHPFGTKGGDVEHAKMHAKLKCVEWRAGHKCYMANLPPVFFESWISELDPSELPRFDFCATSRFSSKVEKAMKSCQELQVRCGRSCGQCESRLTGALHSERLCKCSAKNDDVEGDEQLPVECNENCSCDPNECGNRVLQRGRSSPLLVFHHHKKGLTLRALTDYSPFDLITEMTGEVVTAYEATVRGWSAYTLELPARRVSIDMDEETGEERRHVHDHLVLDSTESSNESRFLSHSCRPNARLQTVYVERSGKWMSRQAVVAIDHISFGVEITIDYHTFLSVDTPHDNYSELFQVCWCGSGDLCKFRSGLRPEVAEKRARLISQRNQDEIRRKAEEQGDSWTDEDEKEEAVRVRRRRRIKGEEKKRKRREASLLDLNEFVVKRRGVLEELSSLAPPSSLDDADDRQERVRRMLKRMDKGQADLDRLTEGGEEAVRDPRAQALAGRWQRLRADAIRYTEKLERDRERLKVHGKTKRKEGSVRRRREASQDSIDSSRCSYRSASEVSDAERLWRRRTGHSTKNK
ncbi:hypothetical protein PFISCL1PPCAC_18268, partial [Pristionchus fissidentatus]